jgi:hypothetical protein
MSNSSSNYFDYADDEGICINTKYLSGGDVTSKQKNVVSSKRKNVDSDDDLNWIDEIAKRRNSCDTTPGTHRKSSYKEPFCSFSGCCGRTEDEKSYFCQKHNNNACSIPTCYEPKAYGFSLCFRHQANKNHGIITCIANDCTKPVCSGQMTCVDHLLGDLEDQCASLDEEDWSDPYYDDRDIAHLKEAKDLIKKAERVLGKSSIGKNIPDLLNKIRREIKDVQELRKKPKWTDEKGKITSGQLADFMLTKTKPKEKMDIARDSNNKIWVAIGDEVDIVDWLKDEHSYVAVNEIGTGKTGDTITYVTI